MFLSCHSLQKASQEIDAQSETDPSINVVMVSEVEWEQLNPARGSNSPMAATLWGDRTGPGPSGFLLKPVDGFRSPPHIHTSDYQGVVIKGSIHNAEPEAADRYLTPGSFWTQPGGAVHVTASKGNSIAYIEVEGAFDVLPSESSTTNNTNEIVIPASRINWTAQPSVSASNNEVEVSVLWEEPNDGKMSSTLAKLPIGFAGTMQSHDQALHAVVIQGTITHKVQGKSGLKTLEPGSYYGSNAEVLHEINCLEEEICIIYIRSDHSIKIRNSM